MIMNNKLKILLTSLCLTVCGNFNANAMHDRDYLTSEKNEYLTFADAKNNLVAIFTRSCIKINNLMNYIKDKNIRNNVRLYIDQIQQEYQRLGNRASNVSDSLEHLQYLVSSLNKAIPFYIVDNQYLEDLSIEVHNMMAEINYFKSEYSKELTD